MTPTNEYNIINYDIFVSRLFKDMPNPSDNIMHAAAGISGEAGEILDTVKKYWAYGKPLDIENMIEELGDLEFYMEAMRQIIQKSRGEILAANMAKLSKRYKAGHYTDEAAVAREDKK